LYVYFEDEPGRRTAAKLLTKDEARQNCGEYRKTRILFLKEIAHSGSRPGEFAADTRAPQKAAAKAVTSEL
jgi:hypothetical protein